MSREILSIAEKIPVSQISQYAQRLISEKQRLEKEPNILRSDHAAAKKEKEQALNDNTVLTNLLD